MANPSNEQPAPVQLKPNNLHTESSKLLKFNINNEFINDNKDVDNESASRNCALGKDQKSNYPQETQMEDKPEGQP